MFLTMLPKSNNLCARLIATILMSVAKQFESHINTITTLHATCEFYGYFLN